MHRAAEAQAHVVIGRTSERRVDLRDDPILDAFVIDEEVDEDLRAALRHYILGESITTVKDGVPNYQTSWFATTITGLLIHRKNYFLGRWIKHGGFWPDPKLRLFRRGAGRFEDRAVHETLQVTGGGRQFPHGALIHHSYPTLSVYLDHMNR